MFNVRCAAAILILLTLLAMVSKTYAQTIAVSGGIPSSTNSGDDITIDVGFVSGVHVLRIYDPVLVDGVPNDDVGKITIEGSLDSIIPSELRI